MLYSVPLKHQPRCNRFNGDAYDHRGQSGGGNGKLND